MVVSHDRYFLERVTDSVWALLGDGRLSMLPRGVEEYLERRAAGLAETSSRADAPAGTAAAAAAPVAGSSAGSAAGSSAAEQPAPERARSGSAEERAARKELARLERQLDRVTTREAELDAAIVAAGTDYERLAEIGVEYDQVRAERDELETAWLEAASQVGG